MYPYTIAGDGDDNRRLRNGTGLSREAVEGLFHFARKVIATNWAEQISSAGKEIRLFTTRSAAFYHLIEEKPPYERPYHFEDGRFLENANELRAAAKVLERQHCLYLAKLEIVQGEVRCLFYTGKSLEPFFEAIEIIKGFDGSLCYRVLYRLMDEEVLLWYRVLTEKGVPGDFISLLEYARGIVRGLHRLRPPAKERAKPEDAFQRRGRLFPLDENMRELWDELTDFWSERTHEKRSQRSALDRIKVLERHWNASCISLWYGIVPGEEMHESWNTTRDLLEEDDLSFIVEPLDMTYASFAYSSEEGSYRFQLGCSTGEDGKIQYKIWFCSAEQAS